MSTNDSGVEATAAEAARQREKLVKDFRAYLHLVIAAYQARRQKGLGALPGPRLLEYSYELAKMPDDVLGRELSTPAWAIVRELEDVAFYCEDVLRAEKGDGVRAADAERMLAQLDSALARMLGEVMAAALRRASTTKSDDLLTELIVTYTESERVEDMIRRYEELFPENSDGQNTTRLEYFTWDTCERVEALDRLADEFPEHIRRAARDMCGWPMLRHRHTSGSRRFRALAKRLELGADYPLDASEGARFRPDTPLVGYLKPLIHRLHHFRRSMKGLEFEDEADRKDRTCSVWGERPEEEGPKEEMIKLLWVVNELPPLTKANAKKWAQTGLVPWIMATDARDPANCKPAALRAIWKQKGVKSRATFKSRLLTAVANSLQGLARPA